MNYPFSRILLATEHSEFDAGAERLAFAMAKRCNVPLRVVVPLLSNPEYEAEMPEMALRVEQEAGGKIAELRKQAESFGIQLDVHVRRGRDIHTEIVNEALESETDLIVIRRRGKPSFLARMLVGEMVSKVIRDSTCSVLLVPRAAEFWSKRILASVGDTPGASNISRTAGMIASVCDVPLTVLTVASEADSKSVTSARNSNKSNVELASAISGKVTGEIREGKPVEQIIAAAKETAADLVVIGRQRYHLVPFGHQSIMQSIAGNMDVPTLVVAI